MTENLRLMCVLAHPDDETLGMGGVLAMYSAEGVETCCVTATRGQKGWFGPEDENPGPERLGAIREEELRAAAGVLGLSESVLLDYVDGELDDADPVKVTAQIVYEIRRVRPQVVVTFGQDGLYGHPDHIAISQLATAAVAAAADASAHPTAGSAHRVEKLYYRAPSISYVRRYEKAFGDLVMHVDGQERRSPGWAPWVITTPLDTTDYWQVVWDAVQRHRSQLPAYQTLLSLSEAEHRYLWGAQEYYRVFSHVSGRRGKEADLFEGIRCRVDSCSLNEAFDAAPHSRHELPAAARAETE
jgi:LmbE family N-acetylglucosaminyl deacetylase